MTLTVSMESDLFPKGASAAFSHARVALILLAMALRIRHPMNAIIPLMIAAALPGCSDVIWRPDLEGAKRDAAKDGRVVLVYYGSSLNRDSVNMDATVFRDRQVIEAMAGTIPVRVDPLLYKAWAQELGISQVPSFAAYGPEGNLIGVRQGAMNEAQFRAFVIAAKLNQ